MNHHKRWALYVALAIAGPWAAASDAATHQAVDPALCRALVSATPDANLAYQPGVDVNGNAVAPADLPGSSQIKMPQTFQIPITLNLASTLGLNTNTYPYNQFGAGTEAIVGVINVNGNNVTLNGQSLSDAQQDKLAVLCMHPR